MKNSPVNFQSIFESVTGLYLILQPDLTIAAVNDAYLSATMTNRDEIVGRGLFQVFPDNPDDPGADGVSNLRSSLNHVIKYGEAHRMEDQKYDIRRPDGTFEARYWSPLNSPIKNENNEVEWIIHRVVDVTQLVSLNREREEMERQRNHLAAIVQGSDEAIFSIDTSHCITTWNNGAEKLYGYTSKEISGKHIRVVTPDGWLDIFENLVLQLKQQQSLVFNDSKGLRKDGQLIDISMTMTKMLNSEGNLVAYSIVERNITAQKVAERALVNKTDELEYVNKELESFTYSVSHDLRAPLRIINGYAEITLSDYGEKLDDEGKHLLDSIMRNAVKMGVLIDDLLNLSRMGRKDLVINRLNMRQLVNNVIEEQQFLNPGKHYDIQVGNLLPADGDNSLMKQVWVNLISNAMKYSSTREKPVIKIDSEQKQHEIIYNVRDNGVGFNMEYAPKLFGVFQRLHKVTEFEGTGVGLALAHRIVTKHGGRIWADAAVDKGATFYFSIPLIGNPQTKSVNNQTGVYDLA